MKYSPSFFRCLVGLFLFPPLFNGCKSPLPFIQVVHQTQEIKVSQHSIPVLKGVDNQVLELSLELNDPIELKEIQIGIKGNESIEGVLIHQLMGKGDQEQKTPLAAMVEPKELNNITIDKNLTEGIHRFSISLIPKPEASLLEKISVDIPVITLGSKRYRPQPIKGHLIPLRLATRLRHHGDDGVHSFRIPGLATTPQGTLLAVYDVRKKGSTDLQGDIDVGMNRSTDGGKTWEPMKIIMDMGEWGGKPSDENGIGDPAVLVDHHNHTIWVIALWAHGKPGEMIWNSSQAGMDPTETGQLILVKSEDEGLNWSEPMNITSQVKNPAWKLMFNGPGKGITMQDGTLVFAGQYKDENDLPHSTIIYSQDQGKTWVTGTGAKPNTTEAQVVELNNGDLMLNMRDNRGGYRSVATTSDLGKTWTEHSSSRSALIDPVCMGSLITYPENRNEEDASYLFFSNPASMEGRQQITIKASKDQGVTWPKEHQVLLDAKEGWGYSCLTVLDKDHLGILYESSQAHMTFQIIKMEEIISVGSTDTKITGKNKEF
jgi:sialidase-1